MPATTSQKKNLGISNELLEVKSSLSSQPEWNHLSHHNTTFNSSSALRSSVSHDSFSVPGDGNFISIGSNFGTVFSNFVSS
jgi:hypothetical protein